MTDERMYRFINLDNLTRQLRCHKTHSGLFFYMLIMRGSADSIIDCK